MTRAALMLPYSCFSFLGWGCLRRSVPRSPTRSWGNLASFGVLVPVEEIYRVSIQTRLPGGSLGELIHLQQYLGYGQSLLVAC